MKGSIGRKAHMKDDRINLKKTSKTVSKSEDDLRDVKFSASVSPPRFDFF